MDIRITGHGITVTDGMRSHLQERLGKYEKYAPRLVESHVILKKQKYIYEAEITLLAKNLRAFGHGLTKENIFSAIDQAAQRVEKQLKKYREKRKDHKKAADEEKPAKSKSAAGRQQTSSPEPRRPKIVQENAFAKPMSTLEASLQLGIGGESFLVFRNAESKMINVIFKRKDGNHGLIEPSF